MTNETRTPSPKGRPLPTIEWPFNGTCEILDANETRTPSPALPCPFCGGKKLKFELGAVVRCVSCCADGPVFDGQPDDEWEAKTIALWNTRTPSTADGLPFAVADHTPIAEQVTVSRNPTTRIKPPADGDDPDEMPEHLRWKGEGPPPASWYVGNTKVYRSYEDYCDD